MMPPSPKLGAHESHLEVWQKAAESSKGIKIKFSTPEEAKAFRFRLYHARNAQQREHKKLYPHEHPMHGRSYFEDLIVKVVGNDVRIEKAAELNIQEIEEL